MPDENTHREELTDDEQRFLAAWQRLCEMIAAVDWLLDDTGQPASEE